MLSLETVIKLNKAGLYRGPDITEIGDIFYSGKTKDGEIEWILVVRSLMFSPIFREVTLNWYFAPKLNQILTEIEALGYYPQLRSRMFADGITRYCVDLITYPEGNNLTSLLNYRTMAYEERDEAAAFALLWIKELGKGG